MIEKINKTENGFLEKINKVDSDKAHQEKGRCR
jgi:hypothetical protein